MCTLMGKDALLERGATVQAMIARKVPTVETLKSNPDHVAIGKMMGHLYTSIPDDVDFENQVKLFNNIAAGYA